MKNSTLHQININTGLHLKKNIDQFLNSQYHSWNIHQSPRKNIYGKFTCGNTNNNNMLRDYVEQIYKQYNILDPLKSDIKSPHKQSLLQQNNFKFNQSQYLTNKKIQLHHNPQHHHQVYQQSHLNSRNKVFINGTPAKRRFTADQFSCQSKDKYSTCKPNLQQPSPTNRYSSGGASQRRYASVDRCSQNRPQNPLKCSEISMISQHSINLQPPFTTPRKPKRELDIKQQTPITFLSSQQQHPPKQSKYCIACEQILLTTNIQHHSQTCEQYTKISQYNFEQILEYINTKIQKLTKNIMKKQQNLSKQDSSTIKKLCQLNQNNQNTFQSCQLNQQFTFNQHKCLKISKKWCQLSSDINKLKYFYQLTQSLNRYSYH